MSAFTQLVLSSSDSEDDVRSSAKAKQQQLQQQKQLKKNKEKETIDELRSHVYGTSSNKKKGKKGGKGTNANDTFEASTTTVDTPTGSATTGTTTVSTVTPSTSTFTSDPTIPQEREKHRLQTYESDLERAIRESLQLQQQQETAAATNTSKNASSSSKGGKTVLSLQEFHTGKAFHSAPNTTSSTATKPVSLDEEEAFVKKQVALEVMKEVSRSNLDLSTPSSAPLPTLNTKKTGSKKSSGSIPVTKSSSSANDTTSVGDIQTLLSTATNASGTPLTIDTLPSISSIQNELQTVSGQQKFLQIYLYQLYELQRLQKDNETLKTTVQNLLQQLHDPSMIEKRSLIDELRNARQESQEYIKEITEFHTKEAQHLSRIHDLENQIFSLTNQIRHHTHHHLSTPSVHPSTQPTIPSSFASSTVVPPPPGIPSLFAHGSSGTSSSSSASIVPPPPGFLINPNPSSLLTGLSPTALPGLAYGLGVSVMGDTTTGTTTTTTAPTNNSAHSSSKYVPPQKR